MLLPPSSDRRRLLNHTAQLIDAYYDSVRDQRVAPDVSSEELRRALSRFDFEAPEDADEVVAWVFDAMKNWGMQVSHPAYYGLFNPASSFAGVLADLLAAAFNPQAGAWHHHPFGVEMERHLVKYFAGRFGLDTATAYGHFTSGGSEANSTGILIALTRKFESFAADGVRSLPGQPVLYVSDEFHHSFEKIAHQCGLGRAAVRKIATDDQYRMSITELNKAIDHDRETGMLPFCVVATAGTTNAGTIDPLEGIADICQQQNLHLHVDAAWGGGMVLSDRLKPKLEGIEHADTITFDPHKLLSVPMAAGMLICRDGQWLADTFNVDTAYVPESAEIGMDNYRLSLQFSRRLIGLKLFMTLVIAGRPGYEQTIQHQFDMAHYLADELNQRDWRVVNGASLAIVCFEDISADGMEREQRAAYQHDIVQQIVDSGRAWISVTRMGGRPVIRACITNYLTQQQDIDELVQLLEQSRKACQ